MPIDTDKLISPDDTAAALLRIVDTLNHMRTQTATVAMEWTSQLENAMNRALSDVHASRDFSQQVAALFGLIAQVDFANADATRRVVDSNVEGLEIMRAREARQALLDKTREEREERLDASMVMHEVNWKKWLAVRLPDASSHVEAGVILRGPNDASFGVLRWDESGLLKLTIAVTDQRTKKQMIQHRFFDVYDVQTIGVLEQIETPTTIIRG